MVFGESEKERKAVSPKIWQEAVATSSVALTKGEAKSAVASNLARSDYLRNYFVILRL